MRTTKTVLKDSTPPQVARSNTLNAFNCTSRQVAIRESIGYDVKGNIVASNETESTPSSIVPESLGEILFNAVCRARWQPTLAEQMQKYGKQMQKENDSLLVDLWAVYVRKACPAKRISRQQIVRAIKSLSPAAQSDSAEDKSRELCRRAKGG